MAQVEVATTGGMMDESTRSKSSSLSTKPRAKKTNRHCAYCLADVKTQGKKVCGKCHRRAYCSRECQALDWTTGKKDKTKGGVGQGHKKWCGIGYGEEDLDWAVVPIPNKGLGIRALRDIPRWYRIIVEGWLTGDDVEGNPRIAELHPREETNRFKFLINCIGNERRPVVGLRLSRVNHDCDANATSSVDDDLQVLILFSNREIKAGEEICFSYYPYNDIAKQLSTQERLPSDAVRLLLQLKWSIECPDNCLCYDKSIQKKIEECFDLDKKYREALAEDRTAEALDMLEEIVDIMCQVKCTPNMMGLVYSWIIETAEKKKWTRPIALRYAEKARDFIKSVYHPTLNKELVPWSEETVRRLLQTLND